jgi:hypothetical protein
VTWRVQTSDLDGSERVHDLSWASGLNFRHVLNGPGSIACPVKFASTARADIEPGLTDVRIYQDSTERFGGRFWNAKVDPAYPKQQALVTGEGIAGILAHRLVRWQVRYEPESEFPTNINTEYGLFQEEILRDLVSRTQAELGGDLGITDGAHIGDSLTRRRWYCPEDGLFLADVFDDFSELSNGLDWALTPTLSDPSDRELVTFNPARGSDLSSSIILAGTVYLDAQSDYEIDAGQIVTRGVGLAEGDCDPALEEDVDVAARDLYGLLEDFDQANSDQAEDAFEVARGLLSPTAIVGSQLTYRLSEGPSLDDYDVGDLVTRQSPRPGWELDSVVRVEEIGVTVLLPDDDEHTFVTVVYSEDGELGS